MPVLSLSADELAVRPPGRLLYDPRPIFPAATSDAAFVEGERLEFTRNDVAAAARVYARLTQSSDDDVRAGALMRVSRTARKLRAYDKALAAYEALLVSGTASAGALPAPLVARLGRMDVFRETGRSAEFAAEARALLNDLQQGRWRLTKSQYDAYAADARAVVTDAPPDDPDAIAQAEAVAWLWATRDAASARGSAIRRPRGPPGELGPAPEARLPGDPEASG
jgi:hypothetical protein